MNKSFPASIDSLYDMLEFIAENITLAGFEPSFVPKVELAAEEALVNIINYANLGPDGKIDIACSQPDSSGIKIIIKDEGIPYDPLAHPKKVINALPVEQRELGGFGIYLIVKIMDEVEYHRENNSNVLTLVKYIS